MRAGCCATTTRRRSTNRQNWLAALVTHEEKATAAKAVVVTKLAQHTHTHTRQQPIDIYVLNEERAHNPSNFVKRNRTTDRSSKKKHKYSCECCVCARDIHTKPDLDQLLCKKYWNCERFSERDTTGGDVVWRASHCKNLSNFCFFLFGCWLLLFTFFGWLPPVWIQCYGDCYCDFLLFCFCSPLALAPRSPLWLLVFCIHRHKHMIGGCCVPMDLTYDAHVC